MPVAAGLGGGSADAAAALRLVGAGQQSCARRPAASRRRPRATGADVPVCLDPRPRLMRGIGEMLSAPLPLPRLSAVLVNPGVALSTKVVFSGWTRSADPRPPIRLRRIGEDGRARSSSSTGWPASPTIWRRCYRAGAGHRRCACRVAPSPRLPPRPHVGFGCDVLCTCFLQPRKAQRRRKFCAPNFHNGGWSRRCWARKISLGAKD